MGCEAVSRLQDQTAYPEKLASERYRVTLKNDAAGKWAVADEKLEDHCKKLAMLINITRRA